MKDLTKLCQRLRDSELRFIKNHYQKGSDKRRYQLLKLALQPDMTDKQAAKQLYGKSPNSAYSHLKADLKQDLFDLLLVHDGFKQAGADYLRAEIDSRRLILQGDILLRRGLPELGIKQLEKARDLAVQYELPTEQINAEDLMRTNLGFRFGEKEYNKYSDSMRAAHQLQECISEAKDLYYSILLPNRFNRNLDKEYAEKAKQAVKRLARLYELTDSANVAYYYRLTGLYYCDFINDYEEAENIAKEFLKLVENEPAISSSTRLANASLQTSNILLNGNKFAAAGPHAQRAVELFATGMGNELVALEQLFFAQFRAGQHDEALQTLEKAFKHPRIGGSGFTKAKWLFYKAGLLFDLKQFSESNEVLFSDNTLARDKSGWLFGYRLLEIMNLMEQEEFDLIEFRVEALRKLIQRQRHREISRIKAIEKVLQRMVKTYYDYQESAAKEKEVLGMLEANEDVYRWDPLGWELIRFDSWFNRKK